MYCITKIEYSSFLQGDQRPVPLAANHGLNSACFCTDDVVQDKYRDGIALDSVFVHPSIVNQLDAVAEEAIAGNSW